MDKLQEDILVHIDILADFAIINTAIINSKACLPCV